MELINWIPTIITAIATTVVALATIYYAHTLRYTTSISKLLLFFTGIFLPLKHPSFCVSCLPIINGIHVTEVNQGISGESQK